MGAMTAAQAPRLVDSLGRTIDYVRLSVTDRCDFRCRYCMPEQMRFLPRDALLRLDELETIASRLVARGIRRIRLTGGEPLVRGDLLSLADMLGTLLGKGLDELTLTTNGARLDTAARPLAAAGIRRVNVSLDTLDPDRFRTITRRDAFAAVMAGLAAADAAGLRVKINMVALAGLNEDEIVAMAQWCGRRGYDLTLIETMPLGLVEEDRTDRFLPLSTARARLESRFTLVPSLHRTGGPARYVEAPELGIRIGFISPLSHNFCASCNRVRVTADGTLFMCLGQSDSVDLKGALRAGGAAGLDDALDAALAAKPRAHDFRIGTAAVARHMNLTGG